MVCWDCSDNWIITAVSDFSIKVWESNSGKLEKVLNQHLDEIFVLEPHPKDSNTVLSAGHDGQLFIWDILRGSLIFSFTNNIEGQGYGAIFDAKWSPDGNTFAASDSHGHLLLFGYGIGDKYFHMVSE